MSPSKNKIICSVVSLTISIAICIVGGILIWKGDENVYKTLVDFSNITVTSNQYYYYFDSGDTYDIYSLNIVSENEFSALIFPDYPFASKNVDDMYVISLVFDNPIGVTYSYVEILWQTQTNTVSLEIVSVHRSDDIMLGFGIVFIFFSFLMMAFSGVFILYT